MTGPEPLLAANSEQPQHGRLWRRIQTVVFVLFCLEMGVVLVLFPWSPFWFDNYFFTLSRGWEGIFSSNYPRGAISGVGLVNVWIAVSEAWRLRSA